jgi:hypothetical protein
LGETLASCILQVQERVKKEMMDNIPVHEKKVMNELFYSSLCRALHEIREGERYRYSKKNFADRYGIDMKEIFEDYYKPMQKL